MRWRQLFLMTMQNKVISSSTLPPSSSLLQKYLGQFGVDSSQKIRVSQRRYIWNMDWFCLFPRGSSAVRYSLVHRRWTVAVRRSNDWRWQGRTKLGRPLAFVFPEKPVEKPAEVYFVEGSGLRFFHSLPFSTFCGEASAECLGECSFDHLCVKDLYSGTFEICDQDAFTIRWHVYGPTKDGDISQQYTRKRQLQ